MGLIVHAPKERTWKPTETKTVTREGKRVVELTWKYHYSFVIFPTTGKLQNCNRTEIHPRMNFFYKSSENGVETDIVAFSNQFSHFQHSLLLQMAPHYFFKSKKIRVFFLFQNHRKEKLIPFKGQNSSHISVTLSSPNSHISPPITFNTKSPDSNTQNQTHQPHRQKQWWDWELSWEVENSISVDYGKMWGVSVTFLGYFQSLDNFWGSWEEPKREIYSMGARPERPVWWHSLKFKTVMPTHVLLTWFHFSLILHVFVILTYTQLPRKFMDATFGRLSYKIFHCSF